MSRLSRTLIIPDVHIPFEDARAFNLMLKVGQDLKPDTIEVLGDFGDFLACSQHDPISDKRIALKDEIYAINKRLDQLDGLGAATKIYNEGNHETRVKRFLLKNAPTLFDSIQVKELLRLRERGWKWYPYQHHSRVGKISYVHDVGDAGVSAHRTAGAVYESSVVIGHTHTANVSYFGNASGETHVCASMGWLGSAEAAEYLAPAKKRRNWQLAFGVAYGEPNGTMHLQLVPIVDYKACVGGKLYKG